MPPSLLAEEAPRAAVDDVRAVSAVSSRRRPGAPEPGPATPSRLRQCLRAAPLVLAIACVLIVASVATGLNVAGSPHYESDEGTYVGSAWSMFQEGKLSYYTYNYDHPLLGWLIIGAWAQLVGGFTALGSSIATARAFMVVVTVGSALVILLIVRRMTGSVAAGLCGRTRVRGIAAGHRAPPPGLAGQHGHVLSARLRAGRAWRKSQPVASAVECGGVRARLLSRSRHLRARQTR